MQNRPVFIGTSQGIINLSAIVSIHPGLPMMLKQNNATFGIYVVLLSDDGDVYLYDDEAKFFLQKMGLINWIPGTSSWADPPPEPRAINGKQTG